MTDVRTFTFMDRTSVRVVELEHQLWFVAADVCAALGITNSRQALSYLDEDEKSQVNSSVITNDARAGFGPQEYSLINESGLYSIILRSRKPGAKPFKRWVTHEVLPTIRRAGAYVDPRRVDTTDPDSVAEAAWHAVHVVRELFVEERAKRWELEQARARDLPKVLVANEFFGTHELMSVRDAARAFGMRERVLADLLREWGWLDLRGSGAKVRATGGGYMENKVALTSGGQAVSGKLTRKGLDRVTRKLVDVTAARHT